MRTGLRRLLWTAGIATLLLNRSSTQTTTTGGSYGPPVRLANLGDDAIREASGLAASRRSDGLFWTHNDSGDKPRIFAVDRRGQTLATFAVTGARARDWEDIAAGPGPGGPALYVGDIGDNLRRRDDVAIYRVPEPAVDLNRTDVSGKTATAERFPLRYPDGPHNAEALLVHPKTGDVFIVTKSDTPPRVFHYPRPLRRNQVVTLERVATLTGINGPVTGGAIAPDGRRAVVRDYLTAYEYRLPSGRPFAAIFQQMPEPVLLALEFQGEAITYRRDGRALLTTSEGENPPLYELVRK